MACGRSGGSIKTRLGFLLYGDYGTWKSSFCLESMKLKNDKGKPFKVLYIDPEFGSIDTYLDSYEKEGYDIDHNMYIVYTQSLVEVEEIINKVKNNEDFYKFDDETGEETDEIFVDADGEPFRPDIIVIDGITLLYDAKQKSIIEFSKKRATVRAKKSELTGMAKEVAIEGAGIEIKDYNTLKFDGQNLILELLSCGKHFIVTTREKDEMDSFKDKNGEIKSCRTGRKIPDGFKGIGYNCKTVMRMFKDNDGIIKGLIDQKDRTLIHEQNEIIIEPSILDWQVAIDRSKSKKDYVMKNTFNESVDNELKEFEKNNAKYDEDEDNTKSSVNDSLTTVEDYCNAINGKISKMSQTEKAKVQTEVISQGLPKAYMKLTDIEQLKKYYDVVSK